ncbi:hypothetical protein Tco_1117405 [Tanacetum coccineum]
MYERKGDMLLRIETCYLQVAPYFSELRPIQAIPYFSELRPIQVAPYFSELRPVLQVAPYRDLLSSGCSVF